MKRREFITLLSGAVATWPFVARAQQSVKVPRIGFLGFGPVSAYATRVEALRSGLRELGYVEGKNIVIEFRWADRVDDSSAGPIPPIPHRKGNRASDGPRPQARTLRPPGRDHDPGRISTRIARLGGVRPAMAPN